MTDQIHPTIVQAICMVQAGIQAVKKDAKNPHGGYMFASTDAIYAELTHKMAAAGLAIVVLEDEAPQTERIERDGKTAVWGRFRFRFVLATAEATWSDPSSTRSVFVQITGPQTFMAAQSYAEKSFYRSLFKLPTGDMDLDSVSQADTMEGQEALAGGGKRKSSAAAKRDGTDKRFNAIMAEVEGVTCRAALRRVREGFAEDWEAMPARWRDMLDDLYAERIDSLPELV